ncbi:hypothetical protein C8R43DRAFT_946230 [Mycena crocata]|nr:hypothetical protein C8R43DRAFT_946230 [Mycena crocata]
MYRSFTSDVGPVAEICKFECGITNLNYFMGLALNLTSQLMSRGIQWVPVDSSGNECQWNPVVSIGNGRTPRPPVLATGFRWNHAGRQWVPTCPNAGRCRSADLSVPRVLLDFLYPERSPHGGHPPPPMGTSGFGRATYSAILAAVSLNSKRQMDLNILDKHFSPLSELKTYLKSKVSESDSGPQKQKESAMPNVVLKTKDSAAAPACLEASTSGAVSGHTETGSEAGNFSNTEISPRVTPGCLEEGESASLITFCYSPSTFPQGLAGSPSPRIFRADKIRHGIPPWRLIIGEHLSAWKDAKGRGLFRIKLSMCGWTDQVYGCRKTVTQGEQESCAAQRNESKDELNHFHQLSGVGNLPGHKYYPTLLSRRTEYLRWAQTHSEGVKIELNAYGFLEVLWAVDINRHN